MSNELLFVIFLIFTGAAVLGTVALFTRQSLLIAYIAVGLIVGPWGLGWVENIALIDQIASIGILFLLFLLGMDLQPQELLKQLKKSSIITGLSALLFALIGAGVALVAGFRGLDVAIIAAAMMFSSTILGLKLLPTTVLHHQRMGEIMIAILLFQDLIAIAILLLVEGAAGGTDTTLGNGDPMRQLLLVTLAIPVLGLAAYGIARWLLTPLFFRFDTLHEYVFLLTIGWCLGMAELAGLFGLSHEIGAFIAGVTLASSPIAQFITESLKPLRDFFLVMFFFSLGASFNLDMLALIWLPALALALLALIGKPWAFRTLLEKSGEKRDFSAQLGARLGQISEFSLLLAVLAYQSRVISEQASVLIQTATVLSFIGSSIWIVNRYPTPIATDPKLRRN